MCDVFLSCPFVYFFFSFFPREMTKEQFSLVVLFIRIFRAPRERERERERISDWILEKPSSEDLTTIKNEQRYLFLERRRRRIKRNAYSVKVPARCDDYDDARSSDRVFAFEPSVRARMRDATWGWRRDG